MHLARSLMYISHICLLDGSTADTRSYFNLVENALCKYQAYHFLFSYVLQLRLETVTCLNTIIVMLNGKDSSHLK